ncbi:hypothetical protein BDV93DRAFT_507307 [Ceratobasidium sp. AG-I]|nr:hypothetical protein BDV93DRAFT_507307 [Ceratobasidium sp. AG-I]
MTPPSNNTASKSSAKSYYTPDDEVSYTAPRPSTMYGKKTTYPAPASGAHESSRPVNKEAAETGVGASEKSGQSSSYLGYYDTQPTFQQHRVRAASGPDHAPNQLLASRPVAPVLLPLVVSVEIRLLVPSAHPPVPAILTLVVLAPVDVALALVLMDVAPVDVVLVLAPLAVVCGDGITGGKTSVEETKPEDDDETESAHAGPSGSGTRLAPVGEDILHSEAEVRGKGKGKGKGKAAYDDDIDEMREEVEDSRRRIKKLEGDVASLKTLRGKVAMMKTQLTELEKFKADVETLRGSLGLLIQLVASNASPADLEALAGQVLAAGTIGGVAGSMAPAPAPAPSSSKSKRSHKKKGDESIVMYDATKERLIVESLQYSSSALRVAHRASYALAHRRATRQLSELRLICTSMLYA